MIAAVLFSLATLAPTAAVDPYAVYDRARAFWLTQAYAPYLTYRVDVSVTQGTQRRVERYNSMYDATTESGTIYVDGVSDYERAHPVVPHGINVCILVCVSKPLPPIDFIGIPLLSPTYSFGMAPFVRVPLPNSPEAAANLVAQIRRKFHDPYPAGHAPLASPTLPTLAHVATQAYQIYAISYDGTDVVNGHTCYHLLLEPRKDPHRYRLRQLWVDVSTSATWRLSLALNFIRGPGTSAQWIVDFEDVDGIHYIAAENATEPLAFGGQKYSDVVVSFEDIEQVPFLNQLDTLYMWTRVTCDPESRTPCTSMEEPTD